MTFWTMLLIETSGMNVYITQPDMYANSLKPSLKSYRKRWTPSYLLCRAIFLFFLNIKISLNAVSLEHGVFMREADNIGNPM